MAAFTASIISCASNEIDSDMWNLYSGTHPDLHDNYMDPPERIMVNPEDHKYPKCCSDKDKGAFNMYYGTQSITENPYTTSAVMEVEKCWEYACNVQCSITDVCIEKEVRQKPKPKERSSKHLLAVPNWQDNLTCNDLRRNKSDSDLSLLSVNDTEQYSRRGRIFSDGGEHRDAAQRCKCKCSCGYQSGMRRGSVGACDEPVNDKFTKEHTKHKRKSRSLKNLIHSILS